MKRLTILRHAKSSWDDSSLGDVERPLIDRGWKAARRVGEELKRREIEFDVALASTAVRVRETLEGFAEGYGGVDFEVRFDRKLYGATAPALLALLRELPDSAGAPLLVGHNPGLQQLALELTQSDDHERARVAGKFPTAAVAIVDLPVRRWADVELGSGTIAELIFPRELD